MARNDGEAAAAGWDRIPPDSPFAARAILARAVLETDRGRLAELERLLVPGRSGRSPGRFPPPDAADLARAGESIASAYGTRTG